MELTLKNIGEKTGGTVLGDDKVIIRGVSSLLSAKGGEISFLADARLKKQAGETGASALIVAEKNNFFEGPQIIVRDPYLAFAKVAQIFAPNVPRFTGISERAFIGEDVRRGKGVSIYPHVYVGRKAVIGDEVVLFPGAYIGERAVIGDRTLVFPNVSIMQDCIIGNDVIIHAGSVIGSDGFGFVRDGEVNFKIPQLGIVEIEDHVEIGANNSIDRASLGKTWIKRGVKTDNLVQIGHNVVIGENTVIVAQVGISGSTKLGKNVMAGGQSGFVDHIEVGDGVRIAARSGVTKSISAGEVVSGMPIMPHRLWLKTSSHVKRLPEYFERIKGLEERLRGLEERLK